MRTWLWTGTCALGLGLLSVGWFGTQADGQDKPPLAPEPKRPSEPVVPPVLNNTQAESPNFRVQATSSRLAGLIAETAERARKDEALRWFDKELPVWEKPVQINIVRRQGGNGGATTFSYRNLQQGDAEAGKKSFTATMELFGDLDVMLTDTLKHEVMHCLLASHFGQPLPRWADEGIALHSESIEQRVRHQQLASYTPEGVTHIPLRELLNAKEYPKNLAMFYAQSYVLCEMLIARKDRATLLTFIADGMNDRWAEAAKKHYGFTSLDEMQKQYARVLANARPTAPETLKTSDGQATFALAQWTGPDQVTIHLTRTKLVRAVNMSRSDDVDEITIVRGQPIKREETIPLLGYRLHTSTTPHPVSLTALKAVDPKGKEIPTATLQTALKIPSPVVLTVGTGLKPDYAKLLQPETIILILAQPLEPQGP